MRVKTDAFNTFPKLLYRTLDSSTNLALTTAQLATGINYENALPFCPKIIPYLDVLNILKEIGSKRKFSR